MERSQSELINVVTPIEWIKERIASRNRQDHTAGQLARHYGKGGD